MAILYLIGKIIPGKPKSSVDAEYWPQLDLILPWRTTSRASESVSHFLGLGSINYNQRENLTLEARMNIMIWFTQVFLQNNF